MLAVVLRGTLCAGVTSRSDSTIGPRGQHVFEVVNLQEESCLPAVRLCVPIRRQRTGSSLHTSMWFSPSLLARYRISASRLPLSTLDSELSNRLRNLQLLLA